MYKTIKTLNTFKVITAKVLNSICTLHNYLAKKIVDIREKAIAAITDEYHAAVEELHQDIMQVAQRVIDMELELGAKKAKKLAEATDKINKLNSVN